MTPELVQTMKDNLRRFNEKNGRSFNHDEECLWQGIRNLEDFYDFLERSLDELREWNKGDTFKFSLYLAFGDDSVNIHKSALTSQEYEKAIDELLMMRLY